MTYEGLLSIAEDEKIEVIEFNFQGGIKGLYNSNYIGIRKNIETSTEKKCVLAEELGHHYTTVGNILSLESVQNRKQELMAKRWGYEQLIPLTSLIKASCEGIKSLYELSEYLDVTEGFLKETLKYYESKYGLFAELNDYCIYFNPLIVCRYNYE